MPRNSARRVHESTFAYSQGSLRTRSQRFHRFAHVCLQRHSLTTKEAYLKDQRHDEHSSFGSIHGSNAEFQGCVASGGARFVNVLCSSCLNTAANNLCELVDRTAKILHWSGSGPPPRIPRGSFRRPQTSTNATTSIVAVIIQASALPS